MGIIRREDADQIAPISFGDGEGGTVVEKDWAIPELGASQGPAALAPPNPEDLAHGGDAFVHSAQSDDGLPTESLNEISTGPQAPPPIFEIPEELLRSFHEQAIAAGFEEGKSQVIAELGILQERFAGALDQLIAISGELESRNQAQLIGLSCEIAKRLVRGKMEVDPTILLSLISDVLREKSIKDDVEIRCSGHDFEYLSQRRPELIEGVGKTFALRIVHDPELEAGDFIMETEVGRTDGTLERRMADVEVTLSGEPDHV